MEGTRLSASVGVYRDAVKACSVEDGGRKIGVPAGGRLMCDLVSLLPTNLISG